MEFLRTFFWNRRIILLLLSLVQPQTLCNYSKNVRGSDCIERLRYEWISLCHTKITTAFFHSRAQIPQLLLQLVLSAQSCININSQIISSIFFWNLMMILILMGKKKKIINTYKFIWKFKIAKLIIQLFFSYCFR